MNKLFSEQRTIFLTKYQKRQREKQGLAIPGMETVGKPVVTPILTSSAKSVKAGNVPEGAILTPDAQALINKQINISGEKKPTTISEALTNAQDQVSGTGGTVGGTTPSVYSSHTQIPTGQSGWVGNTLYENRGGSIVNITGNQTPPASVLQQQVSDFANLSPTEIRQSAADYGQTLSSQTGLGVGTIPVSPEDIAKRKAEEDAAQLKFAQEQEARAKELEDLGLTKAAETIRSQIAGGKARYDQKYGQAGGGTGVSGAIAKAGQQALDTAKLQIENARQQRAELERRRQKAVEANNQSLVASLDREIQTQTNRERTAQLNAENALAQTELQQAQYQETAQQKARTNAFDLLGRMDANSIATLTPQALSSIFQGANIPDYALSGIQAQAQQLALAQKSKDELAIQQAQANYDKTIQGLQSEAQKGIQQAQQIQAAVSSGQITQEVADNLMISLGLAPTKKSEASKYEFKTSGNKAFVFDPKTGDVKSVSFSSTTGGQPSGTLPLPQGSKYTYSLAQDNDGTAIRFDLKPGQQLDDPNSASRDEGQCGSFVNDALGTPGLFADSYKDKLSKKNSDTPQVGAVVIMDTGDNVGHVGIVEKVYADGSIDIADSNWDPNLPGTFGRRTLSGNDPMISGYYVPKTENPEVDNLVNRYQLAETPSTKDKITQEAQDLGIFDQFNDKLIELENITVNPESKNIMAQTGLSQAAFAYLTQGTAGLTRMTASQRNKYMKEAQDWAIKNNIDTSVLKPRYEALSGTVKFNEARNNQAQVAQEEINATLQNMREAVGEADFGKIKQGNLLKMWSGEIVNDPALAKYKFHLNQLRAEFAAYNNAVGGQMNESGGLREITEAQRKEAEQIIFDGLSTGTLEGFQNALDASAEKMGVILKESVRNQEKKVWDLFGVKKPEEKSQELITIKSPEKINQMYELLVQAQQQDGASDEELKQYLIDNGYDPNQFFNDK